MTDPKTRKVSSAPFIDRVSHRAIYQVIDPIVEKELLDHTFACRNKKGNGRAVAHLYKIINSFDQCWIVKMDVRKYFASIQHGRLLGKMLKLLPDDSLAGLLKGLLKSHPDYAHGVGLPLGNLTSQVFANFYLHQIDQLVDQITNGSCVRYMDDLVFVTENKQKALDVMGQVLRLGKIEKLRFPPQKRVLLKNGPVSFLGFLVGEGILQPLNRNRRRLRRKLKHKVKQGLRPSEIEKTCLSYKNWVDYPVKSVKNMNNVNSA